MTNTDPVSMKPHVNNRLKRHGRRVYQSLNSMRELFKIKEKNAVVANNFMDKPGAAAAGSPLPAR